MCYLLTSLGVGWDGVKAFLLSSAMILDGFGYGKSLDSWKERLVSLHYTAGCDSCDSSDQ